MGSHSCFVMDFLYNVIMSYRKFPSLFLYFSNLGVNLNSVCHLLRLQTFETGNAIKPEISSLSQTNSPNHAQREISKHMLWGMRILIMVKTVSYSW